MTAHPLSLEQYLELEQSATQKHEFVDGQLYAMAGASKKHIRLMLNLVRLLESEQCEVYASDLKVIISSEPKVSYYPDVVVVCEDEPESHSTSRPCLVVEVLSDSTERIDKSEKKVNYQRLETLKAYVLVHQNQPMVEVFRKQSDGTWQHQQYNEGSFDLPCPKVSLSLEQIYQGVK